MMQKQPCTINHAPLNQDGLILVGTLITMVFFMAIGLAVAEFGLSHYLSAKRSYVALNALSVAEAGAENFMYNINQDKLYTGTGGAVTFYNDNVKGKGTYETSVQNSSLNNEKIVTAVGKIYLPATAASPTVTRKLKLTIRGIEPFNYSVQSGGSGPMYMYGNTNFTSGKFFSSKYIRMQDNSVSVKGTFMSADKDPTVGYAPNSCSIDGNNNILAGSIIDVRYRVTNPGCGIGTSGSTVTENDSAVVPQPLPTVDKTAVMSTITTNTPCSDVDSSPYHIKHTNYPGSGPACDVTLSNSKAYTLDGNTNISGNLIVDGNTIQVDPSVTTDVYVLVEGTIEFKSNGTSVSSNANNVAVIFVSYSSINSNGDKTQPDAVTIKGNSLSLTAKFLALNGSLGFKGKGTIGPLAANTIVMDGSGNTTFINIAGVPIDPSVWDVRIYQQAFD